jgi:outer membrane protein
MKKIIATALVVAATAVSGVAQAQVPDGNWLVRLRVIDIVPNEANGETGVAGIVPADSIKVDNRWGVDLDITYFFTPNIAAELVLTYPQKHDISISSGPLQGSIGYIKQLPPTLLAQYHFTTGTPWKPYVGAGLTYFWITDNELSVGALGRVLNVTKSNWGPAVQVGVDYALNRNWYLNADVKYIWVSTKVTDSINAGISTTLDVNPWVFGVGVGYRF